MRRIAFVVAMTLMCVLCLSAQQHESHYFWRNVLNPLQVFT